MIGLRKCLEQDFDKYYPKVGRPFGQPALVSDQAAARLDPSGFDQAQGCGK